MPESAYGRTRKSLRNSATAVILQVVAMLVGFFSQGAVFFIQDPDRPGVRRIDKISDMVDLHTVIRYRITFIYCSEIYRMKSPFQPKKQKILELYNSF